jgi:hypothetical protein
LLFYSRKRDPVNAVRSFERQFDNIVIYWTIKKKFLEEEGFEEWLDEQEYVWVDEAFADLYAEDWECPDCQALPYREDDDQMLCLDCWDEANEPDSSESCLTPEWEGSSFVEHDITRAWDDQSRDHAQATGWHQFRPDAPNPSILRSKSPTK